MKQTYGPRMQCYKPVLPIVTLFSQTKDEQDSAQARGASGSTMQPVQKAEAPYSSTLEELRSLQGMEQCDM